MTEFRPCPSYPGYSATHDGEVCRDPHDWQTKTGRTAHRPAKLFTHVGRGAAYVTLSGMFVRWSEMVADAWGSAAEPVAFDPFNPFAGPRPVSDFVGGRVVTVAEWRAEIASRTD